MRPLGLCLDLDGTLYRVRRLRLLWRLRHQRGLVIAHAAARERMRKESGFGSEAALLEREAELVAQAQRLSLPAAKAALAELHQALPAALTRGRSPYEGVAKALWRAKAAGLKLAIYSDYAPRDKLSYLGLDGLPWSLTLGAEQLGRLKPDPAGFTELAARLELPPERLVFIGDREDLDVAGALAAGMRAWRLGPEGSATQAEHLLTHWSPEAFDPLLHG